MKTSAKLKPRTPASKIVSPAVLAKLLSRAPSASRTQVFTNGCFDLLHPGHVSYLTRARMLGDLLIVALNSDASVTRLKGPGRPVNRLKDRATVLAALECVDYVTYFSEATPLTLIKKLRPDVLVKGGDYTIATMVGAREVIANGGRAKVLPFVKGKSTSGILKTIRSLG